MSHYRSTMMSRWVHRLWVIVPLVVVVGFWGIIGPSGLFINPYYLQENLGSKWFVNPTTVQDQIQLHRDHALSNSSSNSSISIHKVKKNVTSHSTKSSKRRSTLEEVENDLAEARLAILAASKGGNLIDDPDYVPNGPLYLNSKAFQRSYLEMEKRLKIYIYEEGDLPVYHYAPCKQTYAIEGIFMSNIEVGRFRTYNPDEANLFFLPISITEITETIYIVDSHDWAPMKAVALDYVNIIAQKYPFWNRSQGADHFIVACHDWGPEISFAVPNLYNNSIRALCNANTSEQFDPSRDVSIPEIHIPGDTPLKRLIGGPRPSQRTILVFYAGGVHGSIRPILLEHWENKSDPDVQIHRYLPAGVSYYGMMRKSRYCLCPSGYEVASPRMVEGLYLGCVPVLIKDGYVAPFSDVLDWEKFAVTVAVKDIPNLKTILAGISSRRYLKLQRAGIQMRRHFMINSPPQRYDVFHMILHSVWLRRLNVRLHENGAE